MRSAMARTAAPEVEWEAQQGQRWGRDTQANSEDAVGGGMRCSVWVWLDLEGSGGGCARWRPTRDYRGPGSSAPVAERVVTWHVG